MKLINIILTICVLFSFACKKKEEHGFNQDAYAKKIEKMSSEDLDKEAEKVFIESQVQSVKSKITSIKSHIIKYRYKHHKYPEKLELLSDVPKISLDCKFDFCKDDLSWKGNNKNTYTLQESTGEIDENSLSEETTYIYNNKTGAVFINNKKYFRYIKESER